MSHTQEDKPLRRKGDAKHPAYWVRVAPVDDICDYDGEMEFVSRCQHGELIGTDRGFYDGSAHSHG